MLFIELDGVLPSFIRFAFAPAVFGCCWWIVRKGGCGAIWSAQYRIMLQIYGLSDV